VNLLVLAWDALSANDFALEKFIAGLLGL